jgi:cytochrome P450
LGFKLVSWYRHEPLGLLLHTASFGGVASLQLGPRKAYLISDPDALHQILVSDAKKYYKTSRTKAVLGQFLGDGLLMSDGDFWRRQRRLTQPAFHHHRINGYVSQMVALTTRWLDGLHDGEERDIAKDMMGLALDIAGKTMFDVDDPKLAAQIDKALTTIQHIGAIKMRSLLALKWSPNATHRQYGEATHALRGLVTGVIDARRKSGQDKGDLLSMLLMATDDEGQRMSDVEALDEAMNLLLAGHDTTALALGWAWYCLSQNPHAEARLHDEIDGVLAGRAPTLEDMGRLKYTEQVFKETLRLYPSAWAFLREPIEDVTVGGFTLPKGSLILIAPYVLHRNPAVFPDPERFDPERFTPENEAKLPRFGYLPFSSGPRVCIGNQFALMEGRAVIATAAQRYQFALRPGFTPKTDPAITLRIGEGGLPMRVTRRA